MDIANALSYGVAWQDHRKKNVFITQHYKHMMLDEVSRRKNHAKDDLVNFTLLELVECLEGKDISKEFKERRITTGLCAVKNNVMMLSAELANKYWEMYAEEKIDEKTISKEIKGIIASKGKEKIIRGRVKIVLNPLNADSFKQGDILVAPMTSPEYIFVMKKAGAIITDTGGMTSHAAIVSRELNKTCIVGTKYATKLLKDGDLVEIDVEKGSVRKIEKM
jgi:phosphohistidine swiveling domain-containing protein